MKSVKYGIASLFFLLLCVFLRVPEKIDSPLLVGDLIFALLFRVVAFGCFFRFIINLLF